MSKKYLPMLYRRRAKKIINQSWQAGMIEDFRLPSTQGKKPMFHSLMARYTKHLMRCASSDPDIAANMMDVIHMREPPEKIISLPFLKSVLVSSLR